jgi:hypothetical protein
MPTDAVEELQLRRWAREHYVPEELRDPNWHPAVHDEMARKQRELAGLQEYAAAATRIVPLAPEGHWMLHAPHTEMAKTAVILQLPDLASNAQASSGGHPKPCA